MYMSIEKKHILSAAFASAVYSVSQLYNAGILNGEADLINVVGEIPTVIGFALSVSVMLALATTKSEVQLKNQEEPNIGI